MTITIGSPTTGKHFGPGHIVHVSSSLGTPSAGHLWEAALTVTATGDELVTGITVATGSIASNLIFMGRIEGPGAGGIHGEDVGAADAVSCTLTVTLWAAGFASLTDGPATVTGLLWDPVSGLVWVINNAALHNSSTDAILAAVQRTVTVPGQV